MTATDIALESLHSTATEIFREALDDCSIESAFDRRLRFEDGKLHRLIDGGNGPSTLDMKAFKSIQVIAIGKAALPMLDVLLKRMPRRVGLRGVCCSTEAAEKKNWRFRYFQGGHPLPNVESLEAARAALALLHKANKDTLVIFLLSGGGSALFDLPLDERISLEDTRAFHQALVGSGAPITEINTIRKHFSAVKGGRLAMAAAEATKLSILLPDVPLRSLDTLASGPSSPDHTTLEEVHAILAKYDLLAKFPASVRAFFEREDLPESPGNKSKRASFLPRLPWVEARLEGRAIAGRKITGISLQAEDAAFQNSMFEVLLSSHDLLENARARAQQAGYYTVVDNTCDDWDYADASRYLLDRFDALRKEHPRCCLISGGEVTVTLSETPGAGGRNMQFALAAALGLAKYEGEELIVFSAGSDGIDGNTRAAGAIVDTTTVRRAIAFGFSPEQALAEFNACPLLTSLGDTVVTGATGHNLRDLRLLISEEAREQGTAIRD
jgi:hydroxypyruvate reductase